MRSFVHKLLVLCCAVYLAGAHWIVLQVTAWTGMIVARAHTTSVQEAVRSTFDGEHPCSFCRVITNGQSQEEQPKAPALKQADDTKLVILERCEIPENFLTGKITWPRLAFAAVLRAEEPPTPPPLA